MPNITLSFPGLGGPGIRYTYNTEDPGPQGDYTAQQRGFFKAIADADAPGLQQILSSAGNVDELVQTKLAVRGSLKYNALYLAIKIGSTAIARILLPYFASEINQYFFGQSPSKYQAATPLIAAINYLMYPPPGNSSAAGETRMDMLRLFLDHGAEVVPKQGRAYQKKDQSLRYPLEVAFVCKMHGGPATRAEVINLLLDKLGDAGIHQLVPEYKCALVIAALNAKLEPALFQSVFQRIASTLDKEAYKGFVTKIFEKILQSGRASICEYQFRMIMLSHDGYLQNNLLFQRAWLQDALDFKTATAAGESQPAEIKVLFGIELYLLIMESMLAIADKDHVEGAILDLLHMIMYQEGKVTKPTEQKILKIAKQFNTVYPDYFAKHETMTLSLFQNAIYANSPVLVEYFLQQMDSYDLSPIYCHKRSTFTQATPTHAPKIYGYLPLYLALRHLTDTIRSFATFIHAPMGGNRNPIVMTPTVMRERYDATAQQVREQQKNAREIVKLLIITRAKIRPANQRPRAPVRNLMTAAALRVLTEILQELDIYAEQIRSDVRLRFMILPTIYDFRAQHTFDAKTDAMRASQAQLLQLMVTSAPQPIGYFACQAGSVFANYVKQPIYTIKLQGRASRNESPDIDSCTAAVFIEALHSSATLRKLTLSNLYINGRIARALQGLLLNSPSVGMISFKFCNFSPAGLALVQAAHEAKDSRYVIKARVSHIYAPGRSSAPLQVLNSVSNTLKHMISSGPVYINRCKHFWGILKELYDQLTALDPQWLADKKAALRRREQGTIVVPSYMKNTDPARLVSAIENFVEHFKDNFTTLNIMRIPAGHISNDEQDIECLQNMINMISQLPGVTTTHHYCSGVDLFFDIKIDMAQYKSTVLHRGRESDQPSQTGASSTGLLPAKRPRLT